MATTTEVSAKDADYLRAMMVYGWVSTEIDVEESGDEWLYCWIRYKTTLEKQELDFFTRIPGFSHIEFDRGDESITIHYKIR